MRDYYEVLQVSPDADPEVIEKAYRVLARKRHPDARAGDRRAHEMMVELN
jgi:molecular chaperone DnaJ